MDTKILTFIILIATHSYGSIKGDITRNSRVERAFFRAEEAPTRTRILPEHSRNSERPSVRTNGKDDLRLDLNRNSQESRVCHLIQNEGMGRTCETRGEFDQSNRRITNTEINVGSRKYLEYNREQHNPRESLRLNNDREMAGRRGFEISNVEETSSRVHEQTQRNTNQRRDTRILLSRHTSRDSDASLRETTEGTHISRSIERMHHRVSPIILEENLGRGRDTSRESERLVHDNDEKLRSSFSDLKHMKNDRVLSRSESVPFDRILGSRQVARHVRDFDDKCSLEFNERQYRISETSIANTDVETSDSRRRSQNLPSENTSRRVSETRDRSFTQRSRNSDDLSQRRHEYIKARQQFPRVFQKLERDSVVESRQSEKDRSVAVDSTRSLNSRVSVRETNRYRVLDEQRDERSFRRVREERISERIVNRKTKTDDKEIDGRVALNIHERVREMNNFRVNGIERQRISTNYRISKNKEEERILKRDKIELSHSARDSREIKSDRRDIMFERRNENNTDNVYVDVVTIVKTFLVSITVLQLITRERKYVPEFFNNPLALKA